MEKETGLVLEDLFSKMSVSNNTGNEDEATGVNKNESYANQVLNQLTSEKYKSLFEEINKKMMMFDHECEKMSSVYKTQYYSKDFVIAQFFGVVGLAASIVSHMFSVNPLMIVGVICLIVSFISTVYVFISKDMKATEIIHKEALVLHSNLSEDEDKMINSVIPFVYVIYNINKEVSDIKIRKNLVSRLFSSYTVDLLQIRTKEEIFQRCFSLYKSFFNEEEVKNAIKKDKRIVMEKILEVTNESTK